MANDTYTGNATAIETAKGPFKGALSGGFWGGLLGLLVGGGLTVGAGMGTSAILGAMGLAGALPAIGGIAVAAILAIPVVTAVTAIFGGLGAGYGAVKGPQKGYAAGRHIDEVQGAVAQKSNELNMLNQRIEAVQADIMQPRATAYSNAPVFVMPGECPHCKVSNMNYQGQAVASQLGLAAS